ncbi:MAG: polyprenyl synthetase family protein [Clostridia bacterium]|nr:polyprenyl synthetase family protein [Clostridia bacterium]
MSDKNFKSRLKELQIEVNHELEGYIKVLDVPEKKLQEAMKYSLMAGGKRLRPILMIATCLLFKENYDVCIPYFVAMEMVHNFSLIHDDLPAIDNDDFRHGKPTNHKAFGESTAILAGDALLNQAYITISNDLLMEKNMDMINLKIKAFNEFSKEVYQMMIGEFVDIECEGKDIDVELLKYMHKNKTGALIKESVRIGALLGEASLDELERLTHYAEKIGLAFQIKDDILSEIGDEKKMGKPVGNDREKNKVTFVTKYGLSESQRMLNNIINEANMEIEEFGDKGWFLKELALYIKNREC